MARRNRCGRPGLTLTEVVVASGLLVISIVPILKALTAAQLTDRVIERKTWSLMLAQQQFERIRAASIYHYDDDFAAADLPLGRGYVARVSDDRDPELRTITVSVGFDHDGDGLLAADEIEARLVSCVARRWPGPG